MFTPIHSIPITSANTKDELLHQTTYIRDSLHRITRIDYPDAAYETFSNYNVFNQALTHRLTSGGTEYYIYDTRGLKQTWQNAVNLATNEPTISTTAWIGSPAYRIRLGFKRIL